MSARRNLLVGLSVATALAVATGCQRKSFVVQHYPAFDTAAVRTVAVLPFYNDTPQPGAGEFVARVLAAALRENGTYTVIDPTELRAILNPDETGATTRPGPATQPARRRPPPDLRSRREELAERLRRDGRADAYITGTVLVYNAFLTHYVDYEPDYGPWHRRRGFVFSFGAPSSTFVSSAHVTVEAWMVRVSDGEVIHATPRPMSAWVNREGFPPRSPERALGRAVDEAASELLAEFAVVPLKVSVTPDKALRTARGREDHDWDETNTFRAADDMMFVVLRLPPVADRNLFRVTITPKDEENTVLAEQEVVWYARNLTVDLRFSPRELSAAHGPGHYQAHLLLNGRRVLSDEFKIK